MLPPLLIYNLCCREQKPIPLSPKELSWKTNLSSLSDTVCRRLSSFAEINRNLGVNFMKFGQVSLVPHPEAGSNSYFCWTSCKIKYLLFKVHKNSGLVLKYLFLKSKTNQTKKKNTGNFIKMRKLSIAGVPGTERSLCKPLIRVLFSGARFAEQQQQFLRSKLFLVGCKRTGSGSYNQVPSLSNMKAKWGREAFDF